MLVRDINIIETQIWITDNNSVFKAKIFYDKKNEMVFTSVKPLFSLKKLLLSKYYYRELRNIY